MCRCLESHQSFPSAEHSRPTEVSQIAREAEAAVVIYPFHRWSGMEIDTIKPTGLIRDRIQIKPELRTFQASKRHLALQGFQSEISSEMHAMHSTISFLGILSLSLLSLFTIFLLLLPDSQPGPFLIFLASPVATNNSFFDSTPKYKELCYAPSRFGSLLLFWAEIKRPAYTMRNESFGN